MVVLLQIAVNKETCGCEIGEKEARIVDLKVAESSNKSVSHRVVIVSLNSACRKLATKIAPTKH
jgi:hypothetical protein